MNIVPGADSLDIFPQSAKIHLAANAGNRLRVCGLDADFKLYEPRPEFAEQLKIFFPQKVSADFKMKIRDSIVMLPDKFPYPVCMLMAAVKRAVYEFDLPDPVFKKKPDFFKHE